MPNPITRRHFLGFSLPAGALLLAACSGSGTGSVTGTAGGQLIANTAQNVWPDIFYKSPADVQEAYRYALSNPDILEYMPCFCGCVNQGHTSNKDCYIQQARPDGSFVLEPMSFG